MGLRERRLLADAREMQKFQGEECPIVVLETEGDPPERYKLEYRVRSLVVQNNEVRTWRKHVVEIFLTLAYPRQAPQCRMLTPVFHPNIAPHAICIGDHWTAGESLAGLTVRIAEMLSFQSYNVQSPLNGEAAQWAEHNLNRLPLERTDFWTVLGDSVPRELPRSTPPPPPQVIEPPPLRAPAAVEPSIAKVECREAVCPSCGASVSIPEGWQDSFARCPLCARVIPVAGRAD